MRFDRESYRKLYVAESLEHRQLSLFARGLRDYLLRFAADDGTLLRGSAKAAEDLCRVLGASSTERRHVLTAVDELVSIGYLTLDSDGRLWITRYIEAQERRSPGALRQERYRDKRNGVTRDASGDAQSDVTSDADSNVTRDVTYKRNKIARSEGPPSGVAREARKPKGSRRVPEAWVPKPAHVNLAMQLGAPLEPEAVKFREHEFYRPTSDWDLAFTRWLRRSIELRRTAIQARGGERAGDQLQRQVDRINAMESEKAKALP